MKEKLCIKFLELDETTFYKSINQAACGGGACACSACGSNSSDCNACSACNNCACSSNACTVSVCSFGK